MPKAEEAAHFRSGEASTLVFLECERFESAARQVPARGLEPLGDVAGDFKGHVHESKPRDG